MYPDISLSVLTSAFSQALFQNRNEVLLEDVYNAIKNNRKIISKYGIEYNVKID